MTQAQFDINVLRGFMDEYEIACDNFDYDTRKEIPNRIAKYLKKHPHEGINKDEVVKLSQLRVLKKDIEHSESQRQAVIRELESYGDYDGYMKSLEWLKPVTEVEHDDNVFCGSEMMVSMLNRGRTISRLKLRKIDIDVSIFGMSLDYIKLQRETQHSLCKKMLNTN